MMLVIDDAGCSKEESKDFFFEKKKQKTFIPLASRISLPALFGSLV
jgi:hypothetical protein